MHIIDPITQQEVSISEAKANLVEHNQKIIEQAEKLGGCSEIIDQRKETINLILRNI